MKSNVAHPPGKGDSRFAFFYRSAAHKQDGSRWEFDVVEGVPLEDVEAHAVEELGANLLGQVLDVSGLDASAVRALKRAAGDHDRSKLAPLVVGLDRVTAPEIDLDGDDPEWCSRTRGALDLWSRQKGITLRWTHSRGPSSPRLHGGMAPAVPGAGHPELCYASLGLWRSACREIGMVPRHNSPRGYFWVWPEDPEGKCGAVDLSPMNRAPERRGSQFRPLGGWNNGQTARKCHAEGSPAAGSPWTEELRDEGLRLYHEQEIAAGRDPGRPKQNRRGGPRHEQPKDLPRARSLPRVTEWVRSVWAPLAGHDLRLSLSATLIDSGLVRDSWGIDALASGTPDREDARSAWLTTKDRIQRGQPCKGLSSLAETVGRVALFDLGWALWQDLTARRAQIELSDVLVRLGVLQPLWRQHAANALAAGEILRGERPPADLTAQDATAWVKRRAEIAKRMRRVGRCGKRGWRAEACPACDKPGCTHVYHCDVVEACPVCAWRAATGPLEVLELPERCTVVRAYFSAKWLAERAARWCRERDGDGGEQALGFVYKEGDRWGVTLVAPDGSDALSIVHRIGVDASGNRIAEVERLGGLDPTQVRGWILRALLARHVHGRELLERGKVESFASFAESGYRRRTVRAPRANPSICWPGAEAIKAHRQERAALSAAERDEEDSTCACPDDLVSRRRRRYEVLVVETLEVIASGLRAPPSFDQALEIEDAGTPEVVRPRSSA